MPGPITLILKKKEVVEAWMNDNRETIAIRMACDDNLKQIIKELGVPVFMTSANKSGEAVCLTCEEIRQKLVVDMIYEAKPLGGLASTIVDCTNGYKVLRLGALNQEDIDRVIK